jgi:excisionase family DNA binding protein
MTHNELPEVFGMNKLREVLPICRRLLYELVKDPSFPSFRCGKKILITKAGFEQWLEQKQQEKKAI